MLFKEQGTKGAPVIILLHGGGLSYWSWNRITQILQPDFHIITPIIDGHGEDGSETFISIEDSARKVIDYIDQRFNSGVFAVAGLSLGAQIAVDIISQRAQIAKYAVIESALLYPMKYAAACIPVLYRMTYGLISKRWFAKLQAKSLFISDDMFERYFADSNNISLQTLINIANSNSNYSLKEQIKCAETKTLIIAGEKELKLIIKSARLLHSACESELYIAPRMGHGEFSLAYPDEYARKLKAFCAV